MYEKNREIETAYVLDDANIKVAETHTAKMEEHSTIPIVLDLHPSALWPWKNAAEQDEPYASEQDEPDRGSQVIILSPTVYDPRVHRRAATAPADSAKPMPIKGHDVFPRMPKSPWPMTRDVDEDSEEESPHSSPELECQVVSPLQFQFGSPETVVLPTPTYGSRQRLRTAPEAAAPTPTPTPPSPPLRCALVSAKRVSLFERRALTNPDVRKKRIMYSDTRQHCGPLRQTTIDSAGRHVTVVTPRTACGWKYRRTDGLAPATPVPSSAKTDGSPSETSWSGGGPRSCPQSRLVGPLRSTPSLPLLARRQPMVRSQQHVATSPYVEMLVAADAVPRLHGTLASLCAWLLLAGFIMLPGPVGALGAVASVCVGVGASGVLALAVLWRTNYVWLIGRVYHPGLLAALAGLVSTLTTVYVHDSSQWAASAQAALALEAASTVFFAVGLLRGENLLLRRLRVEHKEPARPRSHAPFFSMV